MLNTHVRYDCNSFEYMNISDLEVSFKGVERHVRFVAMETAGENDVTVVEVARDWSTADVML